MLQATIAASIKTLESTAPDIGSAQSSIDLNFVVALANGTGAGQASKIFSDARQLAASANEDLDLAGALVSNLGASASFAAVKAIAIRAKPTNTNDLKIGPAAANGFLGPFNAAADRLSLKPGAFHVLTATGAGWAVTGGTGDLLNIANAAGGSPVDYDIVIIGV